MKKVFGYPDYDENGSKLLTTYSGAYADMLMDVRIFRMKRGEARIFYKEAEESAVLLLKGRVCYHTDRLAAEASRKSVFEDGPWCLHMPCKVMLTVTAEADSEILVQSTHNDRTFSVTLCKPDDAPYRYVGIDQFGNVARRRVNTIIDLELAPYSHMVLGEVLNDRGNWSGYLPHRHPQPELYYFRFDRPEGFGASFVGDQVFKSMDGSFAAIPGDVVHPQAAAPGFVMYTCWMIRHLKNQPWHQSDRNEDERYLWLRAAQMFSQ